MKQADMKQTASVTLGEIPPWVRECQPDILSTGNWLNLTETCQRKTLWGLGGWE